MLTFHGYHETAAVYSDLIANYTASICTACRVYPCEGGGGNFLCDLCYNNTINGCMGVDKFLESQISKFTCAASKSRSRTRKAMFEADKKSRCKKHSEYPKPSCKTCETWWDEQTTMAGLRLSLTKRQKKRYAQRQCVEQDKRGERGKRIKID